MIKYNSDCDFGLMTYSTSNLGDYIQSIAAQQFLPRVDHFIDRETINDQALTFAKPVKLIMNGWFCHNPENWPPAPSIIPLLLSFHVTGNPEPGTGVCAQEVFREMPEVIRYLADFSPVGARDIFTLNWLLEHNIKAYFSGCLTLAIDRPSLPKEEFIVANDLPRGVISHLKLLTKQQIIIVSHKDRLSSNSKERFAKARDLLDLYAKASCVVTSRLHSALPCLAFNTPVLLIDCSPDQSRFTGLNDLVHHCDPAEFIAGAYDYKVDEPPPNFDKHIKLRADLIKSVSTFIAGEQVTET